MPRTYIRTIYASLQPGDCPIRLKSKMGNLYVELEGILTKPEEECEKCLESGVFEWLGMHFRILEINKVKISTMEGEETYQYNIVLDPEFIIKYLS